MCVVTLRPEKPWTPARLPKNESACSAIAGAEPDPAAHDCGERIDPRDRDRRAREQAAEPCPLDHQKGAVMDAPDHEGPVRAMPKPADEKDETEIAVSLGCGAAIAAERDVEIVAQPLRQADVPAAPELGDRARPIGQTEIARERKAERDAKPDRHVRVAGEIEIDLDRVGRKPEPGFGEARQHRLVEHGFGQARDLVGDQHLLRKTDDEDAQARRDAPEPHPPRAEAARNRVIADDRARR